jgi:hypothetical protein
MRTITIMMFTERKQNINPAMWITKDGRMISDRHGKDVEGSSCGLI